MALPPVPSSAPEQEQKCCIQKVVSMIIRPPRQDYIYESFILTASRFIRNKSSAEYAVPWKGHLLPLTVFSGECMEAIVLYCHGNSSSRLGALYLLQFLPASLGLACFDFANCGLASKVDQKLDSYISLGLREGEQIDCVSAFLKQKYRRKVVPWGLSMGAVSALLSQWEEVMVLDSPFTDLERLGKELIGKKVPAVVCGCCLNCLLSLTYCLVRCEMASELGEPVERLNVLQHLKGGKFKSSRSYLIFAAGSEDNLIDLQHSVDYYREFKGKKELLLFSGNHNSKRPAQHYRRVFSLVLAHLRSEQSQATVQRSEEAETDRVLIVDYAKQ